MPQRRAALSMPSLSAPASYEERASILADMPRACVPESRRPGVPWAALPPALGSFCGTSNAGARSVSTHFHLSQGTKAMHEIIYLIGLVVVVMFILGLLGVR